MTIDPLRKTFALGPNLDPSKQSEKTDKIKDKTHELVRNLDTHQAKKESKILKRVALDVNKLNRQTRQNWTGSGLGGDKYTIKKMDKLGVEYIIKTKKNQPALRKVWSEEDYEVYCYKNCLFEKLGADFYFYLGSDKIEIPKTRLLVDKNEVVGLACKMDAGFIEFKQPAPWSFQNTSPAKVDISRLSTEAIIRIDDKEVKLPEYARLMIISQWIGDWDVINSEGENLGVIPTAKGGYRLMNIDPEHALQFYDKNRMETKQIARDTSHVQFNYENMKNDNEIRLELAKTVRDIQNMTEEDIRYLVFGDNENRIIPLGKAPEKMKEELEKVVQELLKGRTLLLDLYQDDLEWLATVESQQS
jgi:hypothetical protein